MKRLLKAGCKSTFVVMLVVVLSNVAMAQQRNRNDHSGGGILYTLNGIPVFAAPGQTHYNNLYQALKAQGVESTMSAAQLTSDWHIIQFSKLEAQAYAGAAYGGPVAPLILHFTRGQMVSFGSQTYLVAYRVQDLSQSREFRFNYRYPSKKDKGFVLKSSALALSLLSLDGGDSVYEIKTFDPKTDFISLVLVDQQASQRNLKQVALAMLQYVQDYDEKYPPMVAARNADEIRNPFRGKIVAATPVQNRLTPYAKSKSIFLQPATGRPYLPNYKISRKSTANDKNPSQTFLFYEDAPNARGKRNAAYADGHVQELSEAEFQRERKAQGISESGYPSAAKRTQKAKATPKA